MDKMTFGALVMEQERQLYRIAKSILKNDDDCADAAQEAVAKAFAALPTLRQDRYALTWLIRILIHECYHILREKERMLPLDEVAGDAAADSSEAYSELYDALSRLPHSLRVVLVLHYLEGYAVKEIADMLELPPGTVKSRLHRGRKQLQMIMREMK